MIRSDMAFGELRAALQHPAPSESEWQRLCEALSNFSHEEFEGKVLPYAKPQLDATWPSSLRSTPQPWIDAFLRGDHTPQLSLCKRLWRTHLNLAELRALLRSPHLESICHLELVSCRLDARCIKALIDSRMLERLETLDLSFNPIGDAGIEKLVSSPQCKNLLVLRLDQTHLGDDGAQAIARSAHLTNLHTLTLYNNALDTWGVEELRHSRYLSKEARRNWLFEADL